MPSFRDLRLSLEQASVLRALQFIYMNRRSSNPKKRGLSKMLRFANGKFVGHLPSLPTLPSLPYLVLPDFVPVHFRLPPFETTLTRHQFSARLGSESLGWS